MEQAEAFDLNAGALVNVALDGVGLALPSVKPIIDSYRANVEAAFPTPS